MSIAGNKPSTASVDRDGKRAVVIGSGGKVHHTHGDPSHAAVKSGFAHRHTTDTQGDLRSTRGFAAVKGELPAVDVQPRHGLAKGGEVAVAFGQHHVGEDGVLQTGISRTAAAAALRGDKLPTDPPVVAKRLPIPAVTWGNKPDPERSHYEPENANKVVGEAIVSGSTRLPGATSEGT